MIPADANRGKRGEPELWIVKGLPPLIDLLLWGDAVAVIASIN